VETAIPAESRSQTTVSRLVKSNLVVAPKSADTVAGTPSPVGLLPERPAREKKKTHCYAR